MAAVGRSCLMEHDPNRADGTDSRWKCPISPAPLGRSATPGCIFAMTSSPALAESRSWSTTRRAIPSSCSNRVSPRPVSPTDDWNPLRGRDLLSKPARDLTQAATPVPGLRPERVAPSGQLNDRPRREMAAQHLPLLAHVRVLTPYGPDLGRGICAPALGAGGLTMPRTPICVGPGALWSGRDEVSAPFSHGCDVAGRVCDGPLPSASPLHMSRCTSQRERAPTHRQPFVDRDPASC